MTQASRNRTELDLPDRLLHSKLQKDIEMKQKADEERKKMFKPTIDTNSCKLAAKTEGVLEKAMVKQMVAQTHMVDYFRAEEVFGSHGKPARPKASDGKLSSPRAKAPRDKQTKLPGAKQEFDFVKSKYLAPPITPKKLQLDSPASRGPEPRSSGRRAQQPQPPVKPQDSPGSPRPVGPKQRAEAGASKRSRSGSRGRSKSLEKRQQQQSSPRGRPDPLEGMKGQQVYQSSRYFTSLNEQPRGPQRWSQGSDEEVEIMIQDEDRSPSPAQQPRASRQPALEAKRVRT